MEGGINFVQDRRLELVQLVGAPPQANLFLQLQAEVFLDLSR